MGAGSGDFEGAFDMALATHIGEVLRVDGLAL
jgi:hypothetical protein